MKPTARFTVYDPDTGAPVEVEKLDNEFVRGWFIRQRGRLGWDGLASPDTMCGEVLQMLLGAGYTRKPNR